MLRVAKIIIKGENKNEILCTKFLNEKEAEPN